MIEVRQTPTFQAWIDRLPDRKAQAIIASRVVRVQAGLLGDVRPAGGPVSEIRIDFGPGYRLYFTRRGLTIVILLCGGNKSMQARDIASAQQMAQQLEREAGKTT